MNREISPEERLLHLIKGKKKPDTGADHADKKPQGISDSSDNIMPVPVAPGADNIKDENVRQPSALRVYPDKSKRKIFLTRLRININPAYMTIGIALVMVTVFLYFIFNFAGAKDDQEVENLKKLIASISETGRSESPVTEDKTPKPDKNPVTQGKQSASFDDYQKLINTKAIFAPPAASARKTASLDGPSLSDLSKDLRLVGIIPGDIPQAIIEDKKNNQTLFLREGETINNIEVKSISTGRVVLAYNEETITLSL